MSVKDGMKMPNPKEDDGNENYTNFRLKVSPITSSKEIASLLYCKFPVEIFMKFNSMFKEGGRLGGSANIPPGPLCIYELIFSNYFQLYRQSCRKTAPK